MLDINPVWLLVQMGSFLLFVFLLNTILFKPFLQILAERDGHVKKALSEASAADEERETTLAAIEKEMSEARKGAGELVNAAKAEGLEEQRKLIEKAEAESSRITGDAAEELRGAASAAREQLRRDVENIAGEITGRLLGGKV